MDEDVCSVHHDFSSATTGRDEKCVTLMAEFILKIGNVFFFDDNNRKKNYKLRNIVAEELMDKNTPSFLLKCIEGVIVAHDEFIEERSIYDCEHYMLMQIKFFTIQYSIVVTFLSVRYRNYVLLYLLQ